jgi:predicted small metal-binding protein
MSVLDYAVNVIITHEPPSGARVHRDGTVGVVISKGRQLVLVPDLQGRSVGEALAALGRARLKAGRMTVVSQTSRALEVIGMPRWSCAMGHRVEADSEEELVRRIQEHMRKEHGMELSEERIRLDLREEH